MKGEKNKMNSKIRKLRRNVKAISPIIATLLLIAIAVVAALVTYAWVMGYIGFQTGNVGKSIQITSVSDSTPGGTSTYIIVYVQNIGSPGSSVTFNANSGYVNGTLWTTSETSPSTTFAPLSSGNTATLTLTPLTGTVSSGEQVTVKITTTSGTYSQMTTTVP
jgi:flagellin-like protein